MIYLGSKSPRRHDLLKSIIDEFEVISKDVDESFEGMDDMHAVPNYLSEKKFKAIIDELKEEDWLITADTVVIKNNKIYNKPSDRQEAQEMLFELSGDFHEVLTGVTIGTWNNHYSFTDTTLVFLQEMSSQEIDFYIDHYKPYDKAGSYGIQDWIGIAKISKIEGSYTNVMGLPTQKLYNYMIYNNLIN